MGHPAPMKIRLKSALRRSLSKIRHDGPPPAVPPKDNTLPQKRPSYYSYKHTQKEHDGRHYRQQSYSSNNHGSKLAATADAFPSPPTATRTAMTGSEAPYLKLPSHHDQPLMPRQELLVMNNESVGVARSAPGDQAVSKDSYNTENNQNHVYRQQHCIASVFELDRQQEQQQLEEQQRQLQAAQDPEQGSNGHETWDFNQVVGDSREQVAHVDAPAPDAPSVAGSEPRKYAFPEDTPPTTADSTVTQAEPVVHERVHKPVHEIVRKQIHRDVHHYDEHYRIQPVLDLNVLPTRHIFIDSQGNASELHFEGGKPPPGFEFGRPF